MSTGKGMTTLIEDWIVSTIAAITHDGEAAFRTVKAYAGELHPANGGPQALEKFSPCAFVSFAPATFDRAGGNDLKQVLQFAVAIGVKHETAGVARRGTDDKIGYSKLRDLVIAAIDRQHPGVGFDCDPLELTNEEELYESDKTYLAVLEFTAWRMT